MVLLGAGAGDLVPRADDARRCRAPRRATPGWPRASSTRRCRSAARSGSPCSPRSRRPAPRACATRASSALAALNGGYHLAYLIGAGLILAALAVALTVLQPERKAAEAVEAKQKPAPARGPQPAYDVS